MDVNGGIVLTDAARNEVRQYAKDGFISHSVFVADEVQRLYAALAIFNEGYDQHPRGRADVIVLARVEGEYIIIEEDRTDKPLAEALIQNAGVPETQIIRAYAGEKVPEQVAST